MRLASPSLYRGGEGRCPQACGLQMDRCFFLTGWVAAGDPDPTLPRGFQPHHTESGCPLRGRGGPSTDRHAMGAGPCSRVVLRGVGRAAMALSPGPHGHLSASRAGRCSCPHPGQRDSSHGPVQGTLCPHPRPSHFSAPGEQGAGGQAGRRHGCPRHLFPPTPSSWGPGHWVWAGLND